MEKKISIPEKVIMSKIFIIRDRKVMLDMDLAELYGVTTKRLNEQVKRNRKRFPEDFMFQLIDQEKEEVVAICDHLDRLRFSPYLPYVFTEHGAVMLASVLNSDRAIGVNIQIIRVFVKLRQLLESHKEILNKLDELSAKDIEQEKQIMLIFEYLKQLEKSKQEDLDFKAKRRIGFRRNE